MKRLFAVMVLLLLVVAPALAQEYGDYGLAVVDARNSTRVHLREAATTESNSMGLFFTGTEVECLTDPNGEWVYIKIGAISGYMMGRYLKTGQAADRVTPYTLSGYTTAKNYARLRMGPSSEYKMLCEVRPDDRMTIMGETQENWYYVRVNGKEGYISKNLVRMSRGGGDWSPSYAEPTAAPDDQAGWQSAYILFIQGRQAHDAERYSLCDVNGDGTPDLVLNASAEAGICQIVTYQSGRIVNLALPSSREEMLNTLYKAW